LREVARQRFPDDNQAAEIAARALFDAEEAAAYAVDLDAQEEEQDVLDTARTTTRLRGEFREELRAEGSGAGGNKDAYVHLDGDTSPTSSFPPTRRLWSPLSSRRR
jgi:hypothetical protein